MSILAFLQGQCAKSDIIHRQIFSIPDLISYMSDYFTLEEGDLILTGTPSGVGPVRGGDVISCEIPGVTKFSFDVVNR